MLLVLHWVSSSFVDPYERFVMLLKSRSRTHHPHMHYYTGGRHKNMPSIQIHPKMFHSYIGSKHQKIALQDIHQINAPSFCCYFSKVLLQKKALGYSKVIHKKELRKKWTSVRDIENNGYSDARLKKEMNKIAHVFLQSCFQVFKREMFSKSKVELCQPPYTSTHMHILI